MDVVASGRSKHPGMDRDMKRDNVTRNQQTYSWTAPGRGMEIGTGKVLKLPVRSGRIQVVEETLEFDVSL
jgi:hypothetical protein